MVGLCGNESTITRGLGHADSQASTSESKKASPGLGTPFGAGVGPVRRTWRTSAPAKSGRQMWIGYDGRGHEGGVPGPTSTHMRCERPSLAPIVVTTSVSGSSSTPNCCR